MPSAGADGKQIITKAPPDIEVKSILLFFSYSRLILLLLLQSLLALNPKINPYANSRPSVQTLKEKKHWKRNDEHTCATVCIGNCS